MREGQVHLPALDVQTFVADTVVGEEFMSDCIDDLDWLVDDCLISKVVQLECLEDGCTLSFDCFENGHLDQQVLC